MLGLLGPSVSQGSAPQVGSSLRVALPRLVGLLIVSLAALRPPYSKAGGTRVDWNLALTSSGVSN